MGRAGDHTYKIELSYGKCPHCEKIFESRSHKIREKNSYVKNEKCPYCKWEFSKEIKSTGKGPLFGEASKPEMEWGER